MRLRAKVRRITGNTVHRIDSIPGPPMASVEIVADENTKGFFLLYFDRAGTQITDTWHQTLADAKRQARFEFEIEDVDWVEVGRPGA